MSSLYVRTKVREWCAGLTLPFYDTVNVNLADPPDRAWITLQFMTAQGLKADYCHGQHERGIFDFVVLCQGGSGDAVLAQAEADLATLMSQRDPAGRLSLVQAGPFEDFPQPGIVRLFTLSAAIDYQYFH
jgi:hypothetical protein